MQNKDSFFWLRKIRNKVALKLTAISTLAVVTLIACSPGPNMGDINANILKGYDDTYKFQIKNGFDRADVNSPKWIELCSNISAARMMATSANSQKDYDVWDGRGNKHKCNN